MFCSVSALLRRHTYLLFFLKYFVLFKFDLETFEDKYIDLKWLEGKMAQSDEQVVQILFLPQILFYAGAIC